MSEYDLCYLRSILRNLQELRDVSLEDDAVYGIADEALNDNIDWLDCFIDKHERHSQAHGGNDER